MANWRNVSGREGAYLTNIEFGDLGRWMDAKEEIEELRGKCSIGKKHPKVVATECEGDAAFWQKTVT